MGKLVKPHDQRKLEQFNAVARMELLDEGFTKARDLLETVTNPRELQSWATAVAILIDRKRLEEGSATERIEITKVQEYRERLSARIEELIARGKTDQAPLEIAPGEVREES